MQMTLIQIYISCNGMDFITKLGIKRGINRTFHIHGVCGGYMIQDDPRRTKRKRQSKS